VFLFGLSLFTVASALCGLAESDTTLIAARFLQGIGAAFSSSMVLGILVTLFRAPGERGKAMTVYATIANIGGSIGLAVGGPNPVFDVALDFFINLPIGAAGVIAASMMIPETPVLAFTGVWTGRAVPWRSARRQSASGRL
jgi:MFS family permease